MVILEMTVILEMLGKYLQQETQILLGLVQTVLVQIMKE